MVAIFVNVGVRGPSVADNLRGDVSERWSFIIKASPEGATSGGDGVIPSDGSVS
ncbi:BQ5605_C008g05355 [Microbotryum silenes-dioicae]|uniref:BQ5605_C008g05355 protein n=1 Tax=Microbotryum silenes-dioicae TaxID=796604 RepID=A0A2X0MZV7_9BASI|nr:BQ5605_C008g05355 [Microbotryum silenes-dioicae]